NVADSERELARDHLLRGRDERLGQPYLPRVALPPGGAASNEVCLETGERDSGGVVLRRVWHPPLALPLRVEQVVERLRRFFRLEHSRIEERAHDDNPIGRR